LLDLKVPQASWPQVLKALSNNSTLCNLTLVGGAKDDQYQQTINRLLWTREAKQIALRESTLNLEQIIRSQLAQEIDHLKKKEIADLETRLSQETDRLKEQIVSLKSQATSHQLVPQVIMTQH